MGKINLKNMKKMKLALLSSLFLIFSCGNSETVIIDKQEYNKLKGIINVNKK